MKAEFPPLLLPGFHDCGIDDLRRLCVDRFPHSLTRPSIMQGLEAVLTLLDENGMRGEVWVNGSFTTEKLNPSDCDIVFMTTMSVVANFSTEQIEFYKWFQCTNLKVSHRCDNYAFAQDPTHPANDWYYAYWLRQFGFSRSDELKGLAVVHLPLGAVS